MLLVLLFLLGLSLLVAFTAVSGAPWVPVRSYDVQNVLDDAGVTAGTRYVELGSGDGRLLVAAARRGAIVVGYELNPLLWLVSWLRTWRYRTVSVRMGNFWRADLRNADVVMAFLVPRTMPRLHTKVAKELRPTARLVSYIFEIPGKKPLKRGKSWLVYSYSSPKKTRNSGSQR